jgi:hypothetical protein
MPTLTAPRCKAKFRKILKGRCCYNCDKLECFITSKGKEHNHSCNRRGDGEYYYPRSDRLDTFRFCIFWKEYI